MVAPARGEIWWVSLGPVRGCEQAGRRPALVVSVSTFNRGPRGLIWIVPLTRTARRYPFHVEVQPNESGPSDPSYIMCEQLRSISTTRLLGSAPVGQVSRTTMARVEYLLRTIGGL